MAPDLKEVELQTFDVLQCLFHDDDDDDGVSFRHGDIEPDGPEDDNGHFDPAAIAEQLKAVADVLNKDAEFNAAVRKLTQSATQEVLDQALGSSIETLVQSHVGQKAEVAPELQIIKASVAFGLYMKKAYPNMKSQLQQSMTNFLNQRVGSWVTQQGGWEEVARASRQ